MNKKILFVICLILFISSLSFVSATDDLNQSNDVSVSENVLGTDEGTFLELQEKIDNAKDGSTINMDKDYIYDGDEGGEGITIAKDITIDGKGHTIDGNHATGIFSISWCNVVLKNITFINGQSESDGGAIYIETSNIEIYDCIFIDNNVYGLGGAIFIFNSNGLIENSLFLNNSGSASAIYFDYTFEHDFVISNSVFNNNAVYGYLDIGNIPEKSECYVLVVGSGNLADHQIALYVDQDSHLPYYNFSNLTFVNVSYNGFKNQSYKIKPEDTNPYLDNKTIRYELFKDDELLINSTAVTEDLKAIINLENLSNGDYILNAYYENSTKSSTISIMNESNMKEVYFTMSVEDIDVGDDLIVKFNISSDIDWHNNYYGDAAGDVTILRYDDESEEYVWAFDGYFIFKDNNITIPALRSGSYIIFLNFWGDKNYFPKEINQTFIVYPADYNMTGNKSILKLDFQKSPGGNKRLYINLTDVNGNPLNDKEVFIKINGVTYNRTTDVNGHASIGINLGIDGDFPIIVSFKGDEEYLPTTEVELISLPLSIYCDIFMSKYCKDSQPFYATFLDYDGNYLSSGKATFNINGVLYSRDIDESGHSKLNINLNQGNYTITATNPVTGAMRSCLIEVLPTIVDNNDLVKYYRNDSQYIVRLQEYDISNQKVTFNINGVFYERYSNEDGFVKLNINLNPGEYIITAEFNGCRVSNKITVLPILNATDLKMQYKNGSTFNVILVDGRGNPLANAGVTFNINGVFYERTTDENGIARLNINLMSGEYIITSSYNGCNIANKITVLPILNATDLRMQYKDGSTFNVTLVDGQGNPLANAGVTFNINGVFYERTTDENGIARLNINLMSGEYIITSSYNGCNIANKITISS